MVIFCLISNAACLKAAIRLDENSKCALLAYALNQASRDNYWPLGTTVTLESFEKVGDKYEARFAGRFPVLVGIRSTGNHVVANVCKKRSAFISQETLNSLGVRLPE